MKIEIITPLSWLSVRQLNGSKWWFVMEDYAITMLVDDILTAIFIPAGYRYDRATIWWQGWITKDHLGCIGPLIHDILCHYKGNVPNESIITGSMDFANITPWRTFTRPEVDEIFQAVMLADRVVPWRAEVARFLVKAVPNW